MPSRISNFFRPQRAQRHDSDTETEWHSARSSPQTSPPTSPRARPGTPPPQFDGLRPPPRLQRQDSDPHQEFFDALDHLPPEPAAPAPLAASARRATVADVAHTISHPSPKRESTQ